MEDEPPADFRRAEASSVHKALVEARSPVAPFGAEAPSAHEAPVEVETSAGPEELVEVSAGADPPAPPLPIPPLSEARAPSASLSSDSLSSESELASLSDKDPAIVSGALSPALFALGRFTSTSAQARKQSCHS